MWSWLVGVVALSSVVSACTPSVTTVNGTHAPATVCSGDLIFADEFDEFDLEKWQHENTLAGGGNWEFQYYNNNRTNSFTRNGKLFIRPTLTSDHFGLEFLLSGRLNIEGGAPADRCTNPQFYGCERVGTPTHIINPIKSARIRTVDSFSFRYGRVEVSAKMPAGDWLWPAIWFLPAYNAYGTWPASGEIDLVEGRGNRDLVNNGTHIGTQEVASTLHFGPYPGLNGWERTHWVKENSNGYDQNFHRYQMEWTPDFLKFSIDDEEIGRVEPESGGFWEYGGFNNNSNINNPWQYGSKMAPFDQKFHLIINLAVGGTNGYFPDDATNPSPKPWLNNSTMAATDFWNQRASWLPTWNLDQNDGQDASLQVDYLYPTDYSSYTERLDQGYFTEQYSVMWSWLVGAVALSSAVSACKPSVTTVSGTHAPWVVCSGDLIFCDDFEEFDFEIWQHENTLAGGGNWEFQYYNNNRTNSFTHSGKLFIRPTLTADQFGQSYLWLGRLNVEGGAPADRCTNAQWYGCERTGTASNIINPIKSARIRTVDSFRFRYGKVEVRAKMPAGDWLWPAIWLMPAHNAYGTWPASGAIQIVESRGNRNLVNNGVNIGTQEAGSTVHFGPYPELDGWERTHWVKRNTEGYHRDFHRYQLEWTPDFLKFSIDDEEIGRVAPESGGFWQHGGFNNNSNLLNPWRYGSKMAPFDQKFYLIINLAVGGISGFFPDDATNPSPKPWFNNSTSAASDFWRGRAGWLPTWNINQKDGQDASLQVDYVHVWAL